jgi:hypothetical protein
MRLAVLCMILLVMASSADAARSKYEPPKIPPTPDANMSYVFPSDNMSFSLDNDNKPLVGRGQAFFNVSGVEYRIDLPPAKNTSASTGTNGTTTTTLFGMAGFQTSNMTMDFAEPGRADSLNATESTGTTGTIKLPPKVGRYTPEEIQKAIGEYKESKGIETTTTTMPPICGGTNDYCIVEYDSTGDGKLECCTEADHPVCKGCLETCKKECAQKWTGVKSCFMDAKSGPFCQCTENLPTCYTFQMPPTTTTLAKNQENMASKSLFYIIFFGLLLAAAIAAVKFSNRIS